MYENNDSFATGYALGRDATGGYGDGMCGGGMWGWWIIILLIFGWGGFGGYGGGFGGGGSMMGLATQADIQRGFDNSAVVNKLNGLENGLCDGFYALNTSLLTGFNGVNTNIANLGYQMQQCCCETQRAIDATNYNMAKNTCDITNTINCAKADILGFLTNEKISSLQLENQALKFAASQTAQNAFITANQDAQTAELIRRLGRDCPVPAFLVPNPACCYENAGYRTSGCGCSGCGCN